MKNPVLFLILLVVIPLNLSFGIEISDLSPKKNKDTITIAPRDWFNLDIKKNKFNGVSTERAYNELIRDREPRKVVVAILDSGVDIVHEDLKDRLWTNTDEIQENGIDDDKNGYVDDITGWNFIGGKDGTPVEHDTYEVTRQYALYKSDYDNIDTTALNPENSKKYERYLEIKKEYLKLKEKDEGLLKGLTSIHERYEKAEKIVLAHTGTDSCSLKQLLEIKSDADSITEATQFLIRLKMQNFNMDKIQDGMEKVGNMVFYSLNPEYDPRHIVGDNYEKPDDRFYGNNSVKGPDPNHSREPV